MKRNIPLFYSIIISLIVLIGSSFANYQILREKKSAIKEEILTRAESVFYTLEESIKNEDLQAIDSKMEGFKNEIKQSEDLLRVSVIFSPQFYYYSSTQTALGENVPSNLKDFLPTNVLILFNRDLTLSSVDTQIEKLPLNHLRWILFE